MRKFVSYGPIDTDLHYYTPRTELINAAYSQLMGENPAKNGHYITIWAPRQTGKSWVMNQVLRQLKQSQSSFDVVKLSLQDLQHVSLETAMQQVIHKLSLALGRSLPVPNSQADFAEVFSKRVLEKPLILILDEFDALSADAIQGIVAVFRNIYNLRVQESDTLTGQKEYLLHSLALIGVRAVLGVENTSGSPFNIQRSVRIPNLSKEEVTSLFLWYEKESGQTIEPAVIERVYEEMRGQPGLTCWMGELLSETFNRHQPTLTAYDFEVAFANAINTLPNNNILNIISKAKEAAYKPMVLQLFDSTAKIPFRYDEPSINYLYLNGVVDQDIASPTDYYVRFSSPFVQKRLFNYFAYELFGDLGRVYNPFDNLEDTITETSLYVPNLMRRYEAYLQQNRKRLFQDAPRRRTDDRIYEAVYHFNLYMYLSQFLATYGGKVHPEFPTGNGKIDLIIQYANVRYGVEVKSFVNSIEYNRALAQAAGYAKRLQLAELWLVFFVEAINDENRKRYQVTYKDSTTGVVVHPLFVVTG